VDKPGNRSRKLKAKSWADCHRYTDSIGLYNHMRPIILSQESLHPEKAVEFTYNPG